MICSVCTKELVGVGIVVSSETNDNAFINLTDYQKGWVEMLKDIKNTVLAYHGRMPDGTDSTYFLLHPNCFMNVFDELTRQEAQAALFVGLAKVDDIRIALDITED